MRPPEFHRPRLHCAVLFALLACANPVHAQTGAPSITLQPVPPKTVPPSDYPPGTTIVGQEIILGSVPARVWLEVHVTGFPTTNGPECLRTIDVRIDAEDLDQDGGGYSGASAVCRGSPALGAGDLINAVQPCPGAGAAGNAVCRQIMSGASSSCPAEEPNACSDVDPYPAVVFQCPFAFQDQCDPEWIATGFGHISRCDISTPNPRCGSHVNDDPSICMNDFAPSYLGTLVLDVPQTAKGTYTIDFNESETFGIACTGLHCELLFLLRAAKITIPCGRCCYGVGSDNAQCDDHVSANECASFAPSSVFQPNADCPNDGGTACPVCALDEHCDDGVFCNGPEVCETSGVCGTGDPPCEAYEACEEVTDSCAPRIPTTNFWGVITLGFLLLIAAKLRYRTA